MLSSCPYILIVIELKDTPLLPSYHYNKILLYNILYPLVNIISPWVKHWVHEVIWISRRKPTFCMFGAPGLLHFLDPCEAGLWTILGSVSCRLCHVIPGKHAHPCYHSCSPQFWFVEHVPFASCCHQQQVMIPNTGAIDAWRFEVHNCWLHLRRIEDSM